MSSLKYFAALVGLIDMALGIWVIYQILTNPVSLVFIVVATILFAIFHENVNNDAGRVFASLLLFMGLGFNASFWLFVFVNVFFVVAGLMLFYRSSKDASWNQKQFVAPDFDTDEQTIVGMTSNKFWGENKIDDHQAAFDDVSISVFAGDTIVDLGQSLIPPKKDNYIVIQKAFGKTRVIVPLGTEVNLRYATTFGTFAANGEMLGLHSNTLVRQIPSSTQADRRVNLIVTNFVGDLEVIYE